MTEVWWGSMSRFKNLAKYAVSKLGYDVRKVVNNTLPVELTQDEIELFHFVYYNKFSMAPAEGLYSTMMACKNVIENSIAGDFVECGVWRGGNAILAAGIFNLYGADRKIYLFDTFKGMTEPEVHDTPFSSAVDAPEKYQKNQMKDHNAWCYASLDDVRSNFREAGLLNENVKFIEGDVLSTLGEECNIPDEIAVLRLDTDWYESTKMEMEVLYPRLSNSGILILDDYGHWQGAKKAVDEYFERHGKRPFLQYINYTNRVGVKI
jgi:hypothetical protein